MGLQPDLIYIDANKERDDLEACHRLWPTVQLTGDDYTWNAEAGFPIQKIVHAFASDYGYEVIHNRATWMLQRELDTANLRALQSGFSFSSLRESLRRFLMRRLRS